MLYHEPTEARFAKEIPDGLGFDIVKKYLEDIGETALLKPEEEVELAKTIEIGREAAARTSDLDEIPEADLLVINNGIAAKDHFFRANLRLVVSIAKRFPTDAGYDLLDLIQEGNIGLEHAIDKFEWQRGFRFSTYATPWIHQAIGRAVNGRYTLLKLPVDHLSMARSRKRHNAPLSAIQQEVLTLAEPTHLDRPFTSDGGSLVDVLESPVRNPADVVADQDFTQRVVDSISQCTPLQRIIVIEHLGIDDGEPKAFKVIARDLGITINKASVEYHRAIKALRVHHATTEVS